MKITVSLVFLHTDGDTIHLDYGHSYFTISIVYYFSIGKFTKIFSKFTILIVNFLNIFNFLNFSPVL